MDVSRHRSFGDDSGMYTCAVYMRRKCCRTGSSHRDDVGEDSGSDGNGNGNKPCDRRSDSGDTECADGARVLAGLCGECTGKLRRYIDNELHNGSGNGNAREHKR